MLEHLFDLKIQVIIRWKGVNMGIKWVLKTKLFCKIRQFIVQIRIVLKKV